MIHTVKGFSVVSKAELEVLLEFSCPGGSEVKASASSVGDLGSIPGSGISPGEGNGNPLQYFCWRIPWTEKPRVAIVPGVAKIWKQLNYWHFSRRRFEALESSGEAGKISDEAGTSVVPEDEIVLEKRIRAPEKDIGINSKMLPMALKKKRQWNYKDIRS